MPIDPKSKQTILLVDDDGQLRKLLSALLNRSGYNLITAKDGSEALEMASNFDGDIHLLLSDIEMPLMTGVELAVQISRIRPQARVLLMSGLDPGSLVLNRGWRFLPKPFRGGMLIERIRDLLSEPPAPVPIAG